jgi:hypothetical protein
MRCATLARSQSHRILDGARFEVASNNLPPQLIDRRFRRSACPQDAPIRYAHTEQRLPATADRIGSSSGKIQTRERLGGAAHKVWLERKLAAIFAFRAARIAELFPSPPPPRGSS